MARYYLIWASGVLLLYLISPALSYLIFWGLLPKFSLTMVFSAFLVPTIFLRLLLLLTEQLSLRSRAFALSLVLLVWISVLQFLWYPAIADEVGSKQIFATFAFTLVAAWVTLLGGEAFAYLVALKPRLVRMGILAAYASLGLVVFDGVLRGLRLHGLLLFAFQDPKSLEVYNYLALSDALAIVGLLILSTREGSGFYGRLVLYFSTAILLLFAFSRTSFLLFLLIGSAVCYLWSRPERRHRPLKFLVSVSVLGAAILVIWQAVTLTGEDILERADVTLKRVTNLLSGEDMSFQMRGVLLKQGFVLLKEHWLLGHFMIEVLEIGRGAYVHNWLSFWLAYGIGPFLVSLWLMFSLLVRSWRMRKLTPLGLMAFSLLGFCFLAIALSRSYIWPYIWFALGFTATALSFPQGEGQTEL